MKTISELNNKWWYRLVKVIFSLIVLVLTIISVFFVFQANKTHKVSDSYIKCSGGNKESFYATRDKKILIDKSHYTYNLLSDIEREQIFEACGYTPHPLNEIYGIQMIEYKQAEIEEDNTLIAIVYSFFSIFIWYIIFEIVKRVIYYVILGSINPKK